MSKQYIQHDHHTKNYEHWTSLGMVIKLHKSRQAQSSTYVTQHDTSTQHKPKTEIVKGKNLKSKPKQPLTCLETMCQISHSQDKTQAFHKQLKFKTIQKLKNDHPE